MVRSVGAQTMSCARAESGREDITPAARAADSDRPRETNKRPGWICRIPGDSFDARKGEMPKTKTGRPSSAAFRLWVILDAKCTGKTYCRVGNELLRKTLGLGSVQAVKKLLTILEEQGFIHRVKRDTRKIGRVGIILRKRPNPDMPAASSDDELAAAIEALGERVERSGRPLFQGLTEPLPGATKVASSEEGIVVVKKDETKKEPPQPTGPPQEPAGGSVGSSSSNFLNDNDRIESGPEPEGTEAPALEEAPPAEFLALCAKADKTIRRPDFRRDLRAAWKGRPGFAERWKVWPLAAFEKGLLELADAGDKPRKPVDYFLGIVERLAGEMALTAPEAAKESEPAYVHDRFEGLDPETMVRALRAHGFRLEVDGDVLNTFRDADTRPLTSGERCGIKLHKSEILDYLRAEAAGTLPAPKVPEALACLTPEEYKRFHELGMRRGTEICGLVMSGDPEKIAEAKKMLAADPESPKPSAPPPAPIAEARPAVEERPPEPAPAATGSPTPQPLAQVTLGRRFFGQF
jgi:hypothetical protein